MGSLLSSAIGITAMVAGPRAKMRPGRNIHTATAVHRMVSTATEANAMRRRRKSKGRFDGSLFVATVAVVSDAGAGLTVEAASGAAGTGTSVTWAWNR